MDLGSYGLRFGLLVDIPAVVLMWVVSSVALVVYGYALDYMAGDPHLPRFAAYLLLFCFLMLVFISSDNHVQAFVG